MNYVSKHAIDQSQVESMQNHMGNVLCELGEDALINTGLLSIMIEAEQACID